MDRTHARELLDRLHAAQGRFYAGGDDAAALRALLCDDGEHLAMLTDGTATIAGVEHRWSTIGLYRVRGGRIAACWLLPLDAAAFDAIWR